MPHSSLYEHMMALHEAGYGEHKEEDPMESPFKPEFALETTSDAHGSIEDIAEAAERAAQTNKIRNAMLAAARTNTELGLPVPSENVTLANVPESPDMPNFASEESAEKIAERIGEKSRAGKALKGLGKGLNVLEMVESGIDIKEGLDEGDGTKVVGGGTGLAAGLATMMGSSMAPGLGMFSAAYGIGHTLDVGLGKIAGEMGSSQVVAGRGKNGGFHEARDNRAISARLSDDVMGHTAEGDRRAQGLASYLPVCMGGDDFGDGTSALRAEGAMSAMAHHDFMGAMRAMRGTGG